MILIDRVSRDPVYAGLISVFALLPILFLLPIYFDWRQKVEDREFDRSIITGCYTHQDSELGSALVFQITNDEVLDGKGNTFSWQYSRSKRTGPIPHAITLKRQTLRSSHLPEERYLTITGTNQEPVIDLPPAVQAIRAGDRNYSRSEDAACSAAGLLSD